MTPERLVQLAFDFRAARALFTALELGVFEALARGPQSADELARACASEPRGLRTLLAALVALGVLEREGGRHALPAALAPLLSGEGPCARTELWLQDGWHWARWARLGDAVRTGEPPPADPHDPCLSRPEVLARLPAVFARAMQQSAGEAPGLLARALAPLAPRRVLDLGGGTGETLAALLRAVPSAQGLLADRSFMLERARPALEASGLAGRIACVALDFERDPLPTDCDLILLSRVLMGLPAPRARALVGRAANALVAGGRLAIHDYDARSRVGALLALDVLLQTGGAVHEAEEVSAWLAAAGLHAEPVRPLLSYTRLWIGRKNA